MMGEEFQAGWHGDVLTRRKVLLGAAFLTTAGLAVASEPTKRIDYLGKRKLDALIPQQIGRWSFYSKSGLVVPPQDQLSQQLYSQLLTRVYTTPDQPPIMLLIAQAAGQTGILQIHRPDICYPAGGYKLSSSATRQIPLSHGVLQAVSFTASSDARTEQLIYWTRVGGEMPVSWAQQRIAVAKANLRGEIPDAVLVRVSALTADRDAALTLLDEFVRSMFASLQPAARRVFDSAL